MRLLLDTHIALWAVTDDAALAPEAAAAILAADDVFVSVASLWEIAIKHALGRGHMPVSSAEALAAFQYCGYLTLAIKPDHALHLERLPDLHKDPFDRMLVAQALCEPLTLVTRDPWVAKYSSAIFQVA